MKKNLTFKETIFVASMLFGMFFGAGNLIFPASMGQMSGNQMWAAAVGFLITGVGLPLLGVVALGISRKNGLLEVSSQVGRKYGVFFTLVLYLTIGPFFAIPRCATVAFSVGLEQMMSKESYTMALAIFSFLFFVAVLFFSLRPGEILVWIGKVLNPLFLCFLAILIVRALISPMGKVVGMEAQGEYATGAFFTGVLEGYNTMDALASLAFGIIVVNVIRGLGVEEPENAAKNTVKAGALSSLLMASIYLLVTLVGAQSRAVIGISKNGGAAFAGIADYYFGAAGAFILAVTVTLACLKTAVGLITSCGETFGEIIPKGPSYKVWAVGFCVLSFIIANLGLNSIIAYSLPVLMFLYPLAITLILLTIFGKFFGNDVVIYRWVTGFTAVAGFLETAKEILPFAELGFGWVCPALIGLVIGGIHVLIRRTK